MRGVAYTGNNMRKRQLANSDVLLDISFDMKPVYHKYPEKRREKKIIREIRQFSAVPKSS